MVENNSIKKKVVRSQMILVSVMIELKACLIGAALCLCKRDVHASMPALQISAQSVITVIDQVSSLSAKVRLAATPKQGDPNWLLVDNRIYTTYSSLKQS